MVLVVRSDLGMQKVSPISYLSFQPFLCLSLINNKARFVYGYNCHHEVRKQTSYERLIFITA